jgi:hypothetical protein
MKAIARGRVRGAAQQDRNIDVTLAVRAPLDMAAEQIDRDNARPSTLGKARRYAS